MATSTAATNLPETAPETTQYPWGVPAKFSPEGVVQPFIGNTIVCHLPADCPLLPGMRGYYDAIASNPLLSKVIHLLPQSSWHMTIFVGVNVHDREPGYWPRGKEQQSLAECNEEFSQKLRKFGQELHSEGLSPPYHMKVCRVNPAVVGIGLGVETVSGEEEERMRRLRDRLGETLGFTLPDHVEYEFHITMAYLLRYLDERQKEELERVTEEHLPSFQMDFELGAAEFCTHETLYAFPRVFYLEGDGRHE